MKYIWERSKEMIIPNRRMKGFPRGFTLIELLVVIAIIAVLMAILMQPSQAAWISVDYVRG
jgi:prepilin-type N-terminal cleavage/methylation domain-containing protein